MRRRRWDEVNRTSGYEEMVYKVLKRGGGSRKMRLNRFFGLYNGL